jgi:hypothetical protein
MNELDRKTAEALPSDDAELLGPLEEPPLWEQVKGMFQGRLRWLMVLLVFVHLASVVFAIVSAVCFFRAQSVREMIAWASGFGLGLLVAIACRIFGWSVWQRNAILREVKRVELQIAHLANQLKKPH